MPILEIRSVLAILDTKKNTYISDGYKINQKNRKIMQKEVDKLNIGEKDRYKIHQPMVNVLGIIKEFNPLKY